MIGGPSPCIFLIGSKKMEILWHKANKGLKFVIKLFAAGKVVPVIDRRYQLSEVAGVIRYFGEGYGQGKIIIT